MGLHLGWIPNEPGLRPREFERSAPAEPAPDPATVAALQAALRARGLWSRMLVAVGLFAFVLFGFLSAVARITWGWGVAAGLALCCWLPVVLLALNRRRAATRLRAESEQQATRHAAELAEYEQGKARWAESEAERIATAPRWLQVAAHEDVSRLDVFGGTGPGRQNMVTGLGWELLEQRAVIVLDLTQDRVADGLLTAAARAGISFQDYELPADLGETPLLAGLGGEQIASLIVEVVHADDAGATAAGRATDLMILKKIVGVLGAGVSMGRLHAALTELLGDATAAGGTAAGGTGAFGAGAASDSLAEGERASLGALFGDGFRQQVTGNLIRLAAVIEPLTALGTATATATATATGAATAGAGAGPRKPARLTCLSLAEGPRDVAADLTAALIVQWVTRAVSTADDGGIRPAVILAGADEQSTRHLGRLTAVCGRYDIPLVRTFSRLTEESARHLDTRHTAFLRLATRPEALRAAEHIGLERRFVAGRFARRHSVSQSKTRTTSDSVTHTTGRTEGEATTHTTGTTTGQSYSEAEVPRHDQQVHVHVEDHRPRQDDTTRGGQRRDEGDDRVTAGVREPSGRERDGQGRARDGKPEPRRRAGGGSGKGQAGTGGGKPKIDVVKTKTWFSAKHESDSNTKSWSTTEETSHTSTTSRSRTDGVSVGEEVSYELVYDHQVQPETLMALPEDQMLAPNIVEAAASAGQAVAGDRPRAATQSKLVALVIDPSVVGTAQVAPVSPGEIPAFEPPALKR
jgi:hypothetical protein